MKKFTSDSKNLFRFLVETPDHISKMVENFPKLPKPQSVKRVLIGGMGGSAVSGFIAKEILKRMIKVPVEVCTEENTPLYNDAETLFIPISYSGTTKETLTMVSKFSNAFTAGISSNSDFTEKALTVPSRIPPRFGFFYIFSNLILIMWELFKEKKLKRDLINSSKVLEKRVKDFQMDNSLPMDMASFISKPVLIYTPSALKGVGYRWKTQVNENAKHFAFANYFPELSHNEIVPYINGKSLFNIIMLRSGWETDSEKAQMDFFKDYTDFEVEVKADSLLDETLQFVLLGDFFSFYLAVLNEIDPFPIKLIDRLKSELNKDG